MAKNIIIIGSSGAIGSSFLKYYENENTDNIIYSLSRKPNALRNFGRRRPGLKATFGRGHKIGGGDCLLKTQDSAKPQGAV